MVALLGLALAGAAARAEASPDAPAAGPTFRFQQFEPGAPLRMVAYGDMRFTDPSVTRGTNPRVRKWLAERISAENPAVLLLTGDIPFVGGSSADWQDFQSETAGWRAANILQLPATGNHEVYGDKERGIANYLRNFPATSGHRYYSALLGNVEVISLDCTSPAGNTSPQVRWFAAQLDHLSPEVDFLLILYHIPWVADRQSQLLVKLPSKDALQFRAILEARLDRMRAKVVVFNGHIHNYERFLRRGVEYVITGGGGAEPYPLLLRGHADLYRDRGFPVFHYLTIEVSGRQLHATMWKVKNPEAGTLAVEAKDQFTLTAGADLSPAKAKPGVSAKPH